MRKVANEARLMRGGTALTLRQLRQRMQAAVMKGVARQLLRRITHTVLDEDPAEATCGCDV